MIKYCARSAPRVEEDTNIDYNFERFLITGPYKLINMSGLNMTVCMLLYVMGKTVTHTLRP